MRIFDSHCDTLTKMFKHNLGFCNNGLDWDLSEMNPQDEVCVTYAIFNDGTYFKKDILNIISYFHQNKPQMPNVKCILAIESLGNQPDFDLSDIELYAHLGVRMMSLTWNNDNILCGGIGDNSHGLTAEGKRAVAMMKKFNVIPDVSHISDRGFWDMADCFDGVICASHSNSRIICQNPRNLTDSQFAEIARRGGVVGINLYPEFLSDDESTIDDVARHIDRFLELGGRHSIGIGTDFDGIDKKVEGLETCKGLHNLYEFLGNKYSRLFIDNIFFNNFGRIFGVNEILP